MQRMQCIQQFTVLLAVLLVAAHPAGAALSPIAPSSGAYVGVSIDWNVWKSVSDYTQYAGINPASYSVYIGLPLNNQDKGLLDTIVPQIAVKGALALIVAQPLNGLAAITPAVATSFAKVLAGYEQQGAVMMVQFAHEMNGNWYVWGQQPTAFIPAFQTITNAIRQYTCRTFMLWAPNSGGGYPFPNGTAPSSYRSAADFKAMDTNNDGQITQQDDPYAPFYPGDSYVDWVGCSVYHFGTTFPYGQNVLPEAQKFTSLIFGTFKTSYLDYSGIPNFYQIYSVSHSKPMCVPETAALWNTQEVTALPTELQIKSTWWQQLFNINGDTANALDISVAMPNLHLISWFDQNKTEPSAGSHIVDWRFSASPDIKSSYIAELSQRPSNGTGSAYWKFLPDFLSQTASSANSGQGSLITMSVENMITIQSTPAYSNIPNCLRTGTSSLGGASLSGAALQWQAPGPFAVALSLVALAAGHLLLD